MRVERPLDAHRPSGGTSDLRVTRRFFSAPSGELFAVEQVGHSSGAASQDVVWALPDYQNTVRDLYWRSGATGANQYVEHRQFDPYGQPFQLEETSGP